MYLRVWRYTVSLWLSSARGGWWWRMESWMLWEGVVTSSLISHGWTMSTPASYRETSFSPSCSESFVAESLLLGFFSQSCFPPCSYAYTKLRMLRGTTKLNPINTCAIIAAPHHVWKEGSHSNSLWIIILVKPQLVHSTAVHSLHQHSQLLFSQRVAILFIILTSFIVLFCWRAIETVCIVVCIVVCMLQYVYL